MSLLILSLISYVNKSSFIMKLANIKVFNLQRKSTHLAPKFLQKSSPNLLIY